MLADFKISKTGDLIFKENDITSNKIKINFVLSGTNACKVCFDFNEFVEVTPSKNALKVQFNLVEKTANKSIVMLKEEEALSQLLLMKLKTTLGELPLRPEFGSKISLLKHKDINNSNLRLLEEYIADCISDVVSEPTVKATAYIDYRNGYNQTVQVRVYDKNKNILSYILER